MDDSYILCPGEAFFVQRPVDNGKIVFSKEGRQTNRSLRANPARIASAAAADSRAVLNLTLSDGTYTDRTRVVINEQAGMQYEMERDASKFMSDDTNVPQLFTRHEGIDYAINERPLADGKVTLSACTNNSDAQYTIALTESNNNAYTVVLVDHLSGERTTLTNGESYTFREENGQTENRFTLLIGDAATDIDGIDADTEDNSAIYTMEGIKVSRPTQKGVYIQNGKKVVLK